MEVQKISEGHIKPSQPTPRNLKTFKLCLLDQLIPFPYAPIILFYPSNGCFNHLDEIPRRLALLKKSLSETLTRFYPIAGRINDDLSIDCNDQGAYFVETRVLNTCLDEFLTKPDLLSLQRFLPCDVALKEPSGGAPLTNVQVNVFECGGIAIGVCITHKILDGFALSTFLGAWTERARGCEETTIRPYLSSASSLFPANDLWLRDSATAMFGSLFRNGEFVTKRFVFDAGSIATLKAQADSVASPTRVEVVSAFIWKTAMAASREKHGSHQRPSLLTHFVNLRRRMMPSPLRDDHSVGNLLWISAAQCTDTDSKLKLDDLVGEIKNSISRINGNFVSKLRYEEEKLVMQEFLKEIGDLASKDEVDYYGFTSWCKLGFYESDFGWGNPIWVSSFGVSSSVFMNLVILVDTRFGHGIEAWITLDQQDMALLERDPEFLNIATLDLSPSLMNQN